MSTTPDSYCWIDTWADGVPRNLTPGLDRLQLGQRIITFFELAEFEPDVHKRVSRLV